MVRLVIIIFVFIFCFANIAFTADSLATQDVYAEYCFQKTGSMELKLSKVLKKIEPISIAETDSVKCKYDSCNLDRTTTLFNIPGFEYIPSLSGCFSSSFRSTIKTTYDSITGKLYCTTEYIFGDMMKNYSSLINIDFPEEKDFFLKDYEELSLKDMQKFVGKEFLAEWETKIKCEPIIDTTYSGKYYIRIVGECSTTGL